MKHQRWFFAVVLLASLAMICLCGCATAATNVWLGDQVKTTTVKGSNYVQMAIQRVNTSGTGSNGLWRLVTANNFVDSLGLAYRIDQSLTNMSLYGTTYLFGTPQTPSATDKVLFSVDPDGNVIISDVTHAQIAAAIAAGAMNTNQFVGSSIGNATNLNVYETLTIGGYAQAWYDLSTDLLVISNSFHNTWIKLDSGLTLSPATPITVNGGTNLFDWANNKLSAFVSSYAGEATNLNLRGVTYLHATPGTPGNNYKLVLQGDADSELAVASDLTYTNIAKNSDLFDVAIGGYLTAVTNGNEVTLNVDTNKVVERYMLTNFVANATNFNSITVSNTVNGNAFYVRTNGVLSRYSSSDSDIAPTGTYAWALWNGNTNLGSEQFDIGVALPNADTPEAPEIRYLILKSGNIIVDSPILFKNTVTITNAMTISGTNQFTGEIQAGSLQVTGAVTAASFVGDGSGLTNMPASGGGGTYQTVSNITASGTFSVDPERCTNTAGLHYSITLTANSTFDAPTNTVDGQDLRLRFVQDATGGRTVATNGTADAYWKFGTMITGFDITTNAGAVSYITMRYYAASNQWHVIGNAPGY